MVMKLKKYFVGLLLLLVCFVPGSVFAKIGVGVGTGKIQVDESLMPGTIYELPVLTVLNTGDEESNYEVLVAYHSKQQEKAPFAEWFVFTPREFHLKPGEAQSVEISLNLPVKTEPGDYFAYLESQPVVEPKSGGTSIGIAAATKLYFTVVPANIFQGIYHKAMSLYEAYSPWSDRIAVAAAVFLGVVLFKKFFNVQVNVKQKNKTTDE